VAGRWARRSRPTARTCREYGGSLITATQSLNDFYKSEGSLAALENSDWSIVLQQKEETINDLAKHQRFEMDHYSESLLRSLKRNGTEYSDVPDQRARDPRCRPPRARSLFGNALFLEPAGFLRDRGQGARRPRAPRCDRTGRLSPISCRPEPGAPDFAEGELAEAAE